MFKEHTIAQQRGRERERERERERDPVSSKRKLEELT